MSGPYSKDYLLERQSDEGRLKRRSFESFAAALRSGRLVGFTGSYATKHLGYDEWKEVAEAYVDVLKNEDAGLSESLKKLFENLKEKIRKEDTRFHITEIMDLAELLGKVDRHASPDRFKTARKKLAKHFLLKKKSSFLKDWPDINSVLVHDFGLRRIITLNYDLELERTAFLSPKERKSEVANDDKDILADVFGGGEGTRREKLVPGFGPVVSEVLGKENSAELSSFALHDDDVRCRILHLHGRADMPCSMILSRRDYRDLYWQAGFTRLPFEYALRSIFSGNPILFVGIGMTENEINAHFEQVLSDNPNRRSLPIFLLWKSHENEEDDQAFRLLYNRKLGVSVLFDKEIARFCGKQEEYRRALDEAVGDQDCAAALRMALPLKYLAEWSRGTEKFEVCAREFRDPQDKYKPSPPDRLDMWHAMENQAAEFVEGDRSTLAEALSESGPLVAITGKPGSGRGNWAEKIAEVFGKTEPEGTRVVVVNGSFATETDSIFAILTGAFNGRTAFSEKKSRIASTRDMISFLKANWPRREAKDSDEGISKLVLIINGMERFVAHNGTALSTELDVLIRLVTGYFAGLTPRYRAFVSKESQLHLFLIGSPRLMRYLEQIAPGEFRELTLFRDATNHCASLTFGINEKFAIEGKSFFEFVRDTLGLPESPPEDLADSRLRKRYFEQLADQISRERGSIAFAILRAMAFIGQPVERHVLPHIIKGQPSRDPSANPDFSELKSDVEAAIDWLQKKGVILAIREFPGQSERVGLHKSLVAEIRERYGIPLSDARLAASFNLGLYAAQPLDGVRPDQEWHDELARMVDFLCGQYRDKSQAIETLLSGIERMQDDDEALSAMRQQFLDEIEKTDLARIACSEQSDCLRAALSLMRSYFSTASLVMHPNHELDTWLRNAPLTDHADRLRRLIRMFETNALLRQLLLKDQNGERLESITRELGAPAFYSDDLCWLYNELGVVLVTQGNLMAARDALEKAMTINNSLVEFGERHHNWRRIAFNLVQVAIDQGRLSDAEELLREIETSLEKDARLVASEKLWTKEPWSDVPGAPYDSLRDYALRRFSRQGGTRATRAVDQHFPANLLLGIGLVLGYRGLCKLLRGDLTSADQFLSSAVRLMELLGEERAFAIFQRHRVSLLRQLNRIPEAIEAQKLCVSSAGPSRQTDIDHSGRLALVESGYFAGRDEEHSRHAQMLPQLKETLRYATACDMYRLQIEALQSIAFMQLKLGDTDTALAYVSDAIAIASRHDFGLRKISLRALFGKILASRNQKEAARKVLEEASLLGTRRGYARGSEIAENELVRLGADRISMNAGTVRWE